MAVSGTMAMDRDLLWSGSGAIGTQRGDDIWGANWIYHRDGLQNDILVIAEEYKNLSTSGAYATDSEVYNASGTILVEAGGLCYVASGAAVTTAGVNAGALIYTASGVIVADASGGAVTVAGDLIYVASGVVVADASGGAVAVAGDLDYIASGYLETDLELQDYNASGAIVTLLANASGAITTDGSFVRPTLLSGIVSQEIRAATSGDFWIGTADYPFSGLILSANDTGVPMRISVHADGSISGVAV